MNKRKMEMIFEKGNPEQFMLSAATATTGRMGKDSHIGLRHPFASAGMMMYKNLICSPFKL